MNHIEDNSSKLYLSRAFDRNDKKNILDDQEIPKSTQVALVVFSRSDKPIYAYAGLGCDGLSRRIEPHQKKKFSFITSQNYTLRDVRLRVERNLKEHKVEKIASYQEESSLFGQDLFRKRKREKEIHNELEKKENKKFKSESFDGLDKKRKRDAVHNERITKKQCLSSFEDQSLSDPPQKISNLPSNPLLPLNVNFQNSPLDPKKLPLGLRLLDLDTGMVISKDGPFFPGHRVGLTFRSEFDQKIRLGCIPRNSNAKLVKIINQGFIVNPRNQVYIPQNKDYDLGYIIPEESDGKFISIDLMIMPIIPGCFQIYTWKTIIPIEAVSKATSSLTITSGTIEGGFYERGSRAVTFLADNNTFFEETGADPLEKQGSRENY